MVFAGLPNYTQVGLHKDGLRIGTGVVMAMPMKMNPRINSNEQITTSGNAARGSRHGPGDPTKHHLVPLCAATRAARINNRLGLKISVKRINRANCS